MAVCTLGGGGGFNVGSRFDSNCITPGTEFMQRLGVAFRKWIEFKMEVDPFWR